MSIDRQNEPERPMRFRVPQSIAIVPAAGRSRRMGVAKLLLPWDASTVIETVLSAWSASRVDHVVLVVHPDDVQLADVCRSAGAEVVAPATPPPEMITSVQIALAHAAERFAPAATDVWLLAPADMPNLTPAAIDQVLGAFDPVRPAILAPSYEGRRGHPVLFPWALAAEALALGPGDTLRTLVDRHGCREVVSPSSGVVSDLDTPDDYLRQRSRHGRN